MRARWEFRHLGTQQPNCTHGEYIHGSAGGARLHEAGSRHRRLRGQFSAWPPVAPQQDSSPLDVAGGSAMVLRQSGRTVVLEQFVDCRQKLRFVKRLDDAGIVSDRTFPLRRIRFCVGRNKEAGDLDAIPEQAVPEGKTTHAGRGAHHAEPERSAATCLQRAHIRKGRSPD